MPHRSHHDESRADDRRHLFEHGDVASGRRITRSAGGESNDRDDLRDSDNDEGDIQGRGEPSRQDEPELLL